ncbi:MarR family winged helix-turn-helix transcriptional regulator [Streptomyces apricus]|uniref:MarR family transcriptional regulator n=1 Tax=Streptomyces apricus TaxID=1828112 RepID=A0A5B0AJ49_9ACTN|nr:MarR family transcriptional regulator [Streptomyces apricus]KAA0929141.1 MarR family transcriptional regulator [Streptomyces apricus]
MTTTEPPTRPPQRLLALASWQANKVATLGARLTTRRMQLSARADFAVLAALEEYGALSQADIGRCLGLDRNDVNGILNRLEGSRHVDREVDPADRRRNVISLTPSGGAYLQELQAHTDAVQAALLAGLDPAEQRQLHQLLAKLLDTHPPQSA